MCKTFYLILCCFLMHTVKAEFLDNLEFKQFCYPAQQINSPRACECSRIQLEHALSQDVLRIDCSYKHFKTIDLPTNLPLQVYTLDVSWNALNEVPALYSDSLAVLNLMHNNITIVNQHNFADTPNLRELYLNWNSIQALAVDAFKDLQQLEILDLSHNNVHALPAQIFSTLPALKSLSLAWNRQLAANTDVEQMDFYEVFGLQKNYLAHLDLEACGLSSIVLPLFANLSTLNLHGNQLTRLPATLPKNLLKLDGGGNLLRELLPQDLDSCENLQELLIQDSPQLKHIAANAFHNVGILQKLSFENSRRLEHVDGNAFALNAVPMLKYLSFRGTALHTLNGTTAMHQMLSSLQALDLYGVPLHCDCHLTWLKTLPININAVCVQPARLRGRRIADIPANEFDCRAWPDWVYGLIIFALILLCSACIYFIVMGLKPYGNVTMRRKVGAGSPYARVTIEPNNQEYNHF